MRILNELGGMQFTIREVFVYQWCWRTNEAGGKNSSGLENSFRCLGNAVNAITANYFAKTKKSFLFFRF